MRYLLLIGFVLCMTSCNNQKLKDKIVGVWETRDSIMESAAKYDFKKGDTCIFYSYSEWVTPPVYLKYQIKDSILTEVSKYGKEECVIRFVGNDTMIFLKIKPPLKIGTDNIIKFYRTH